jgi:hypothetical protein
MKNRKGEIVTVLAGSAVAVFVGLSLVLTLASGGPDLAKKNGQSIWAHMVGACAEGSTDSRCIMK